MYCRHCGVYLDDSAAFCTQCGMRVTIKRKKNSKIRYVILGILLGMDLILAGTVIGVKKWQKSEEYLVNTVYKTAVKEFTSSYDEEAGQYSGAIVCEEEGKIYIKSFYKQGSEICPVVGICQNGEWIRTEIGSTAEDVRLRNENLLAAVNERIQESEGIIAVYDEWNRPVSSAE